MSASFGEVVVARTGPQAVVRLRLRRRGDRWSVEKQIRIAEMTIPPSYRFAGTGGRARGGAWYELTDAAGEVLYRRMFPHAPGEGVEVPSGGGGLQRAGGHREVEEYDVIVPDVADMHRLNVYVVDPAGDASTAMERSRTPVASLQLRRGRKR
jgi:hypothetical protein